jgi:4-diphosphocytidyl-2-C-methyl-D-erythritol kinase
MKVLKKCYANAPCKINLHLRVKDKRSDGFHELESIFAALAFGDSLCFELTGKEANWELLVNQSGEEESLATEFTGEKNLISKAVAIFRSKTGFCQGVRCKLEKRIPLGAGLGGGSSDAASTLLALNLLSRAQLPWEKLLEMAAILGSDVPFFLTGGAAWVSGRGEHIEPLPRLKEFVVLLVKPPFQSATNEAFQLLDIHREKNNPSTPTTSGLGPVELKNAWIGPPQSWPFFNDFLPFLAETEVYQRIIKNLREAGALFSGLSGSGSCCFGIFENREKAGAAKKFMRAAAPPEILTHLTFFLASGANLVVE